MKRKGAERKFEEIVPKTSQIWWKTLLCISEKLNELQAVWTQREAHGQILKLLKDKDKERIWETTERSNPLLTRAPQ